MTQPENTTIRRRPDGSIDISFYARRAAQQRRTSMHAALANWFQRIGRTLKSVGPVRVAGHSASSHPGRF